MLITQKHKYALRAVFELSKHYRQGPIKLADIASNQAIPLRYLEVIMAAIKPSGLVTSKRGYCGGYSLLRRPDTISVGDLFRYLDNIQDHDRCHACDDRKHCPLTAECPFKPMWDSVQTAIYDVFDQTSIQDLLDNQSRLQTSNMTIVPQPPLVF